MINIYSSEQMQVREMIDSIDDFVLAMQSKYKKEKEGGEV